MATVYMAVKSGSDGFKKIVALKRIHKHLAGNAVLVDMLVDEARLATRINHPNVCQVLDFGLGSGKPFPSHSARCGSGPRGCPSRASRGRRASAAAGARAARIIRAGTRV